MLNRNRSKDTDEESEGPQFFNRWFWLSTAFLGLVLVMGVGVIIARSVSGPSAAPNPTATPSLAQPSPSSSTSTVQSAGGDCSAVTPADVGSQTLPTTAPPTTWDQFGGGTLISPTTTAGPYVRDSTIRRCFAQTRLGAMTAAANIYMAVISSPPTAQRAIENQMTTGAQRDEALKNPGGTATDAERIFRLKAARILSFSPDRTITEVVIDLNQGEEQLLTVLLTMIWDDGDWKVDGSSAPLPEATESLDGFMVWEAGR